MEDPVSVRVIVRGRVQGVFFRAFAAGRARELGVRGYVRNRRDGSVEVVAEGEKKILEELIRQLKAGPPAARVDKVETSWDNFSGRYASFAILPSE